MGIKKNPIIIILLSYCPILLLWPMVPIMLHDMCGNTPGAFVVSRPIGAASRSSSSSGPEVYMRPRLQHMSEGGSMWSGQ